MSLDLNRAYERDRAMWDACARTYEEQIVAGHPDVTAYESFEEDLIDRMLIYLIRDRKENVYLYDVGCGSARLHLRYGLKTVKADSQPEVNSSRIHEARKLNAGYGFSKLLARGLASIGGVDFSAEMVALAREKLITAGLSEMLENRLVLEQGSAFELQPFSSQQLPFLVTVCNSIGVMQGPEGAMELFKSMRRAVEDAGGIALISGYRKDAVQTFALGNYESTMNVCGQPRWLEPDLFAGSRYTLVPQTYKRAYDPSDEILVDVFDRKALLVGAGVTLKRNPLAVGDTIRTGHIQTYTDYESYWHSWDQMQEWIDVLWPARGVYHLEGRKIDALRAVPVQLAILDAGNHLEGFFQRWLR
jgi:SAM-dependent methyltransferase